MLADRFCPYFFFRKLCPLLLAFSAKLARRLKRFVTGGWALLATRQSRNWPLRPEHGQKFHKLLTNERLFHEITGISWNTHFTNYSTPKLFYKLAVDSLYNPISHITCDYFMKFSIFETSRNRSGLGSWRQFLSYIILSSNFVDVSKITWLEPKNYSDFAINFSRNSW